MATILQVEDDMDWTERSERLLGAGHEITDAGSIEEARDKLSDRQFDLVICDGDLSTAGDGADFAVEVRQTHPTLKVMIFSASEENQRNGIPFLNKRRYEKLLDVVTTVLAS